MHIRVQENFKYIKANIQVGNSIVTHDDKAMIEFESKKPELQRTVEFTRELISLVSKNNYNLKKCLPDGVDDNKMIPLSKYLLIAILADIYKVGRCHELACLGLIRFLKEGIQNRIEVVSISGTMKNRDKSDHVLLVLNRDTKSDICDPSSWNSFIKFDVWADMEPKWYAANKSFTRDILGSSVMHTITKIESLLRCDERLTLKECKEIVFFLHNVKNVFTEELVSEACDTSCRDSYNVKKELKIIKAQIDKEIVCFENLIKSPPISPEFFAVLLYKNPPLYCPSQFFPKCNQEAIKSNKLIDGSTVVVKNAN